MQCGAYTNVPSIQLSIQILYNKRNHTMKRVSPPLPGQTHLNYS